MEHALEHLTRSWNETIATPEARKQWIVDMFRPVGGDSDSIALYYKDLGSVHPPLSATV